MTGLVPDGVVTRTSTVPPGSAGVTAWIRLSATTVKLFAGALPKLTAFAPVKPVPVMATEVFAPAGPLLGDKLVTTGTVLA